MWNNGENRKLDNIIAQISDLTVSELKEIIPVFVDMYSNKKHTTMKKTGKTFFNNEEKIRMIQPNSVSGKTLTYLFRNISWEKQKPIVFTRKQIAEKLGRKPSEISRATKHLIHMGLVTMHREFFKDTRKFRNLYNLTTEGIWTTRWMINRKTREAEK